MGIQIEFFGVARQRIGAASVVIPVEGTVPLGVLLARLAEQFPNWAAECLDGDRMRPSYIINVDGHRFVHDPREPIADNASLLIMSADAGG